MRIAKWPMVSLVLVTVSLAPVWADDDAKNVIEKAIKAHGGREILKKNRERPVYSVAQAQVFVEEMELSGTMEITGIARDKTYHFRHELSLKIMDMDVQQTVGFDGKELWIALNGQILASYDKKEDLDILKDFIWAEEAADLVALDGPDIKLSIIGEDKVGDHAVVGVRVSKKGHSDVAMYFDQKTFLLRKIENRSLDFVTRQEVEQQRILENYVDFEGQKVPKRMTIFQDGKKLVELEVKEYKYLERVENTLFSRPK